MTDESGILGSRASAWWLGFGLSIPAIAVGRYDLVWVVLFVGCMLYISRRFTRATRARIEYKRQHPTKSMEEEFVPVDITITNRDKYALYHVIVSDRFTSGSVNEAQHRVGHITGGESLLLRYASGKTSRRGQYITGPGNVEWLDIFGISRGSIQFPQFLPLTVYPQIEPLYWFPELYDATHRGIGSDISHRGGGGEELMTLRHYVPGDSIRRIHWPTSARNSRLMVRLFEENISTEVTCICDLTLLSQAGIGNHNSSEYRIRLTAALADEIISRHHYFRLVLAGESAQASAMASGHRHLTQILDLLTVAKASGMVAFDTYVEDWLPRVKRNGTLLVVCGSLRHDLKILTETALYLRTRRMKFILIIVEDQSFSRVQMEHEHLFHHSPSATETAEELRAMGVTVHVISQFDSEVQIKGMA